MRQRETPSDTAGRRPAARPTTAPPALVGLLTGGANTVMQPDGTWEAYRARASGDRGVLGSIAQDDVKRVLSFMIVSQIGYIVMGLGFFTAAGVAAAVFSMIRA